MERFKKDLIGKRFYAEDKVFTVYAVSARGVFAHEGEIMETTEAGDVIDPRYFDYEDVEANLVTAGRPSIGVSKRVALTLPEEVWKYLYTVKAEKKSLSAAIRDIVVENYEAEKKPAPRIRSFED